jgi:hypothetical protein
MLLKEKALGAMAKKAEGRPVRNRACKVLVSFGMGALSKH